MVGYPLDPHGISHESAFAWTTTIPVAFGLGDTPDDPRRSRLILFEEERPLMPAHATHDDIRGIGRGAYSHWHDMLYFSTSDGTDPRRNGRAYRVFADVAAATAVLGKDVAPLIEAAGQANDKQQLTPFNQDNAAFGDPVAAAKYDKQIFDAWSAQITRWRNAPNLRILEIGPGISLGAQALLVELGHEVTVADAFAPRWHPEFHPAVYRHLSTLVGGSPTLERAASDSSFAATHLRQVPEPAEQLTSLHDGEFDLVFSNAVLEHVADLDRVCAELARVTRPGGLGIHQIDLAYHKDRARPLDHLLLGDLEFLTEARLAHFEYGNRWRKSEFIERFERSGFEVISHAATLNAESEYLAHIGEQLQAAGSRYGGWPLDDLGALGLFLVCRRAGSEVL